MPRYYFKQKTTKLICIEANTSNHALKLLLDRLLTKTKIKIEYNLERYISALYDQDIDKLHQLFQEKVSVEKLKETIIPQETKKIQNIRNVHYETYRCRCPIVDDIRFIGKLGLDNSNKHLRVCYQYDKKSILGNVKSKSKTIEFLCKKIYINFQDHCLYFNNILLCHVSDIMGLSEQLLGGFFIDTDNPTEYIKIAETETETEI